MGLHFSNWKVAVPSNKLKNVNYIITQICFHSGSAFVLMKKYLTVMLLKITGVIRTYKLRGIIQFGSGFNFADKLYFESKLMKREGSSGVLPQEQHGVRSRHISIEVVVLIRLVFGYVIYTRRNSALGSYDSENFYDYVAHNFDSLN